MPDIFISYKREERRKARAIAEAVASRGYDVWWDIDLLPGDKFADEIEAVIRKAKVAVVLWSKSSVKSDFVRAEALLALKRKILTPVCLDDASIPLPFSGQHILDLKNWNGSSEDPLLIPLLDAVEEKIGTRQPFPQSHSQIEVILERPEAEIEYWTSISKSSPQNTEEYEAYLLRYGNNATFSDLAELRIKKLESEKRKTIPKIARVVAGAAAIVGLLAGGVEIADRFGLLNQSVDGLEATIPARATSADNQGPNTEEKRRVGPMRIVDLEATDDFSSFEDAYCNINGVNVNYCFSESMEECEQTLEEFRQRYPDTTKNDRCVARPKPLYCYLWQHTSGSIHRTCYTDVKSCERRRRRSEDYPWGAAIEPQCEAWNPR